MVIRSAVTRAVSTSLVILLLISVPSAGVQSQSSGNTGTSTSTDVSDSMAGNTVAPLYLEVEGRPLLRAQDVLFYGDRVPRSHFSGDRYVSERRFFEIAGDEEAARKSRNHRALNLGLGALSILSFFAGMALFSTADDVELSRAGIDTGTTDRGFSLVLIGGSLVPAAVLTARRQYWAPLEYTYQTMQSYNEARQENGADQRDDSAE